MKSNQVLAIFAGRGILPKILINECQKNNKKFVLFLLESETYEIDYSEFNPYKIKYGEVEKFLNILKNNNAKEIVFIGAVNKPNFSNISIDGKGKILLAKILASKILGDDAVLRAVINFFKKEGFKVLSIDNLIDCLIKEKKVLSLNKPNKEDLYNIKIAQKAILSFSKFDVGQSVVVAQKQIILVEALEGTDAMIERCKNLSVDYKNQAILVKTKKRSQTKNADLPTIGIQTIINCHNANIKGIAIQSKYTIVLEKEKVIKQINDFGMFLISI